MNIHPFIKAYLLLALRINKIFDGYVDSYYGPSELKYLVENEPISSPKVLIKIAKELLTQLPQQINDPLREKCLKANLKSMKVFLEVHNGRNMNFFDQIEAILGIRPEISQSDRDFYDLQKKYKKAYFGTGSLADRMELYKNRRFITPIEIIPKFVKALEIVSNRTKELFPDLLPDSEICDVQLTEEQVGWSFFNHYKGNFKSVIEINASQPLYWTSFLPNAAHEGYPGHHTEFTVKNELFFNQLNWSEQSIILMNTPAGVITEGIAEIALFILFPPNERVRIELNEFCLYPNKEDSIQELIDQIEVRTELNRFKIHLANLANINNFSEKELFDYAMNFGFYPKENLESLIRFILKPKFRIIQYTYNYGIELISKKFGFPPKLDEFKYLLSNPVLPSDLS